MQNINIVLVLFTACINWTGSLLYSPQFTEWRSVHKIKRLRSSFENSSSIDARYYGIGVGNSEVEECSDKYGKGQEGGLGAV